MCNQCRKSGLNALVQKVGVILDPTFCLPQNHYMPPYKSVKGGRPTGRSRTYSASRTRSYYKQYMKPQIRRDYGATPRTMGAAVTGEMKYFDTELQPTAISACTTTWVAGTLKDPTTTINLGDAAVATPGCLFAPKVSAALNGRIGRKVKMLKCKVTGGIHVPAQGTQAAGDSATMVRVLLVLDTQSNAGQMTAAQLLNDAGTADNTLRSYQNPNNFGRFRVLKEKWINLSDPNMAGSPTTGDVIQGSMVRNFKFSYKFKNPVLVNFNATNGGTVADIIDNSLHIIAGCELASYAPTIFYYSRVSYKE